MEFSHQPSDILVIAIVSSTLCFVLLTYFLLGISTAVLNELDF